MPSLLPMVPMMVLFVKMIMMIAREKHHKKRLIIKRTLVRNAEDEDKSLGTRKHSGEDGYIPICNLSGLAWLLFVEC